MKLKPLDSSGCHYRLRVEFEDVDSYGIAYHAKLISYLERARVDFFNNRGVDLRSLPFALIVYKLETRFIKPALFLENLKVEVNKIIVDNFYLTVIQRIVRDKETILKAKVVHALINIETGELTSIPHDFARIIKLTG